MQSTTPENLNSIMWWKSPGYYVWLAAIGAIVYAFVFANSESDMTNTTEGTQTDSATGKPTVNTGARVLTLLPLVGLYTILVKIFTSFSFQFANDGRAAIFNACLIGVALIVLAFVSIWATQTTDGVNLTIIGKSGEREGFFGTNITLIGLIFVLFPAIVAGYNAMQGGGMDGFRDKIYGMFKSAAQFIFNFWFPLMMMYYFIKTGATHWFQVVAGVFISISILILCYDLFKIYTNQEPLSGPWETLKQSLRNAFNTFPLSPYLKYVEDANLNDVAKRVLIVALLGYVAYLMISVYKSKHRLVPCVGKSFASCFWDPNMNFSGYDKTKDTPFVNALFYTLIMSVGINIFNVIIQVFSLHRVINNKLNGATDPIPPMSNRFNIVTLIQMILFPFYWILKLFAEYPLATIIAFIAFAALGVLLYRSSFDLTAFVEGQRGTVITVFSMIIAALLMFGAYIATKSSSSSSSSSSSASASSSKSGASTSGGNPEEMSLGQFILRPFLLIAVAACIVGLLMFFLNSSSRLTTIATLVQYGITIMIYLAGIAIAIGFVRTMFSTSRKMGDSMFQISEGSNTIINILKLIGNLLFFIPCLLVDTADMVKEQYKLTTSPILILLAMEAAFILAGHFLPSLVTKAINHTGIQILSDPITMSKQSTVNTYQIQFVDAKGVVLDASGPNPPQPLTPMPTPASGSMTPTQVQLHNYSYGVSAWVYIHPQPPNTNSDYDSDKSEINIFNFGGSFGPNISYTPKTNALNVTMAGESTPSNPIPPITDIPLQTWNNIVVNSDKGAIDIFINGKLIYTGTHIPSPNSAVNSVVIGQDGGVQGEICNVVLNREPFTQAEIAWFYNTNKMLNPPLVGVNPADSHAQEQDDEDGKASSFSTSGAKTFGIMGAIFGAIFGWLFNNADSTESTKGLFMGAVVFGLIGTLLGALFSTDGTIAYILKTVANVFVDTF